MVMVVSKQLVVDIAKFMGMLEFIEWSFEVTESILELQFMILQDFGNAYIWTFRSSSNQRKDNEGTLKTTTRNHRDGKDKYKDGELLYRELAELTKLDSVAIDQLIAGINPEIWRKRRAGLTPLANYLKQNNTNTSTLLGNKPDVELVNALAWYKERWVPKLQQRVKNMKMHCEDIQQTAMAMMVAFCAARMTELVFMKQSEMIDDMHSLSLKTQTSKGKYVVIHTITFEERSGICCPVKTLRKWIQQRNIDGISEDQI
ncbi:MAG: hypothetical protein EZS28_017642 [Streblomastix strix]|uniref:Tyr recombinase domain-containing protein n=1 Tax=Streblomastix strix TaxID=222440 RepID=A0A5J4VWI4_9EUKA|nr:MAG: hypothetical protein EZS28_017642 [Streblomastix strix]